MNGKLQAYSIIFKKEKYKKATESFVDASDGKVIHVKVLRGITKEVDQEIIKSSPDWISGQKDGKPVSVKMVIPISFKFK